MPALSQGQTNAYDALQRLVGTSYTTTGASEPFHSDEWDLDSLGNWIEHAVEEGVWVHNRGPACQRLMGIMERKLGKPGFMPDANGREPRLAAFRSSIQDLMRVRARRLDPNGINPSLADINDTSKRGFIEGLQEEALKAAVPQGGQANYLHAYSYNEWDNHFNAMNSLSPKWGRKT